MPIQGIATQGTVNAIFRIGDEFVARFPLEPRDVGATQRWLESEMSAARELMGRTRIRTPMPVAQGQPGAGYPLPWSVQTWLPGVVATEEDPGESVAFAHDLAEFIDGVRAIDTHGRTFSGRGRGGDLRSHDAWMTTCFEHSEELLDVPRVDRCGQPCGSCRAAQAGDVMTHGDLIPGNVLVSRTGAWPGSLTSAVWDRLTLLWISWAAWHLLEAGPRQALRKDLRGDDLEWERGKAWAFEQAMGAVWYYIESNSTMSRMGLRTLERIMAG